MSSSIGYFTTAWAFPEYDPGLDIDCPVCHEPLRLRPRVTVSVAYQEGRTRSYFYRLHKMCHAQLTIEEERTLDSWALGEAVGGTGNGLHT